MRSEPNCIFCRIIAGKIPSAKIFENNEYIAFLDINPIVKGHSLVVAKNHVETIDGVPPNELTGMLQVVQKVVLALEAALGANGTNVIQNNGKAAGQLVPHVHFHIVPRYLGDNLDLTARAKYSEGEMQEIAKKVADRIKP